MNKQGWRTMRRWCLAVFLVCASASSYADVDWREVSLSIGSRALIAEVAATPDERSLGLMNREFMAEDRGMVFVFEQPGYHCFWMRNTLIPLTVIFLDAQQRIFQTNDMQPLSEQVHCANQPAHFALEVNQGWLQRQGLQLQLRRPGGLYVESTPPLASFLAP
ncbi:DUF192 domain-containing protein [Salinispirillum sp. LH 10-3-1]|uniref:DUF192 domain-containing protein n=1 Tax=Salinispirillum sp. LH 10-3-1 TaxID=2952525 RepID=A0AB38YGQ2_9GAMM